MMPVKTCVYAISLNEAAHVDGFMDACEGADLVLVCDTGSTDGTPDLLRARGATVYRIIQQPWRFDVPRNTALSLVPRDIDLCLSIDLDEHLQPGWSDVLNAAWQQHAGNIHRVSYDYVWNWTASGQPDVRFNADKIHHRLNYRWRHPCHETLYWQGEGVEQRVVLPDLHLHHHADTGKSRGQYLHLLKMAVEEDANNDRMRHYYARELMFRAQYQEAIEHFQIHLKMPSATWQEERAASLRYISRCYRNLGQTQESQDNAILGTLEWPHTREPWLELARAAYAHRDWPTCYYSSIKCLNITHRTQSYMGDAASWGSEPHDLAGIAAWNLGLREESQRHCLEAYRLNPQDARLKNNCILAGVPQNQLD
jgi:tetratricopeptide (TPR) repeat protein